MLSEDLILALLLRSYTGDRVAYTELLNWLQNHCQYQLRIGLRTYHHFPQELKLDITQEILIAFHQNHQTFDTSRPFLPWINAMIRHKTIDFIRRKDFRVVMSSVDIDLIKQSWVAADQQCPAEAEDVLKLLDNLPKKQASIIKLSKIEGYSNKEIAAELKMTESNVKVTLFRTLKILKKILSDQRE